MNLTRSQQSQALKATWLSITFVYQVHKFSFCITIKELLWGISVTFGPYQTLARKLGCRLLQVPHKPKKILTGSYLLFLSHYLRRLWHNIHLPSCPTVPFRSALMRLVACVTYVLSFSSNIASTLPVVFPVPCLSSIIPQYTMTCRRFHRLQVCFKNTHNLSPDDPIYRFSNI